jgi:succinyl-CoA synthetase beta subunit
MDVRHEVLQIQMVVKIISKLLLEIGYMKVNSLTQDGKPLTHEVSRNRLRSSTCDLIAPGASTTLDMRFKGQVPVQIRRSGRNNSEGVGTLDDSNGIPN